MPELDTRPTQDKVRSRDRAVDVARLTALVVVMFGHCALLLATIDSGGVRIGNLLGELPPIAPVTWVVQVMPLFFLAGGAEHEGVRGCSFVKYAPVPRAFVDYGGDSDDETELML